MSIRNYNCVPELNNEGEFLKPLDVPSDEIWRRQQLRPFERMHAHHTLASARRYAYFRPFSGLIPRDALDFVLSSPYDHSLENFPDPIDPYLQPETMGLSSWRRLRNTSDSVASMAARAKIGVLPVSTPKENRTLPFRLNEAHPVIISGLSERKHPSNVKLMNSGHHSPQTNGGYSRQVADGTFYQY